MRPKDKETKGQRHEKTRPKDKRHQKRKRPKNKKT
jgi:hypothetical protein